jgi:acylglycerol lipase
VIHHGLADHSDRYARFAERLVRAGYAVWAFDMRGHGRSAGARVQIDRIDHLLDDLDAFLAVVREREPGRSCCTATASAASPRRSTRSSAIRASPA